MTPAWRSKFPRKSLRTRQIPSAKYGHDREELWIYIHAGVFGSSAFLHRRLQFIEWKSYENRRRNMFTSMWSRQLLLPDSDCTIWSTEYVDTSQASAKNSLLNYDRNFSYIILLSGISATIQYPNNKKFFSLSSRCTQAASFEYLSLGKYYLRRSLLSFFFVPVHCYACL